jgi:hypothetical protein
VIGAALRDPRTIIGTFPRLREKRKGTIMVYIVDREKLEREDDKWSSGS